MEGGNTIPVHVEKGPGKAVACLLGREAAVLPQVAVEGHPVTGRPLSAYVPAPSAVLLPTGLTGPTATCLSDPLSGKRLNRRGFVQAESHTAQVEG